MWGCGIERRQSVRGIPLKPDIFSIAFHYQRLGDEDMLTALWHYVLSSVPDLGQAFVDDLSSRTGLPPSRFVGALDHPRGDRENRPDLLVQCADWSVLFEHKLESPLGLRQLERYVDLARQNKWRFAVMAKRPIVIGEDVLRAPEFVTPTDPQEPRHFLWQNLQPLLRASGHPLAQEFAEFMEERGLGTFSWAGFGNPFFSPEAADTLRLLYGSVKPVFGGNGVRFIKKATSLVYEVRRPFPPVHLINIGPIESVAQEVPSLRGPAMALWAWVERGATPETRTLPMRSGPLRADPDVHSVDHVQASAMTGPVDAYCERSYYTPLSRILLTSPEDCSDAMRRFAMLCVDDIRADLTG